MALQYLTSQFAGKAEFRPTGIVFIDDCRHAGRIQGKMIRPTTPEDTPALLDLAVVAGLFERDQLDFLRGMLADYFADEPNDNRLWITDDAHGPVGVAYVEAERLTEGTWNLQMIAIQPDCQRQGRGAKLVRHVEQFLAARGARVLIVETSGLPNFESTREFYGKCGFNEEARIREFYKAGDDKIIFRKALPVR